MVIAVIDRYKNKRVDKRLIGATDLPLPMWASGLLFGLLLSLPDAIITKSWIPIMTLGAIGGVLCGVAIGAFGI